MKRFAIITALMLTATNAFAGAATSQFSMSLATPVIGPLPVYSGEVPRAGRDGDYRITHNTGGSVEAFRALSHSFGARRKVIDGWCASACLILLDENTCTTPRGQLSFHAVRDRNGMIDAADTARVLHEYPAALRRAIEQRGGMGALLITMPASAAFPACR